MKRLVLILMLAGVSGLAQTKGGAVGKRTPSEPEKQAAAEDRWTIQTLAVEGASHYPQAELLTIAGLKVGQIAGKDEFEAARDRLIATGAFETVGYRFEPSPDGRGYVASFQVTEVEVLPVRFDELGVPDAALESALRAHDPLFSMDNIPASQPVIGRYTGWIQQYLASQGITEKVSGSVAPWPEQLAVVFRRGESLPVVAEVSFEGNQALSDDDLLQAVSGAAIGVPYTEPQFRQVLAHSLVPAYETRGFLRVAFPKIRTETAEGVRGIHVFVTLAEGPAFQLDKVTIPGPAPLKSEVLLKAGDFPTGETANFERIGAGISRIRQTLRRAGYLDAQVAADRDIHDKEKTVDLALTVDAGAQYLMGALNISGLDLSGEAEMRRLWGIQEGKPFNPEYPDYFLKTIRDQDMFEHLGDTKAETKTDPATHTADVTLTFAAAKEPETKPVVGPSRYRALIADLP